MSSEENEGEVGMEDQQDETSGNDSDNAARLSDFVDVLLGDESSNFIKREPISSPQINQHESADSWSAQCDSSATPASRAQAANPRGSQRPMAPRDIRSRRHQPVQTHELEAVVSCTSDGLVMVLRRARPPIPSLHAPANLENGLLAAPWSEHPVRPHYPNYPSEFFHAFRPLSPPHYMSCASMVEQEVGNRMTN